MHKVFNDPLHPTKGLENGLCNRSACLAPGASWYNIGTQAWYCEACAVLINYPGGRADTMRLFGVTHLCTKGRPETQ